MIDLFCGRGGWTKGFLQRGWECIGFDIVNHGYPAQLVIQDVLTLIPEQLSKADFICASSPCEQFSVWGMRHFHPKPSFPQMGKLLFEHTKQICELSDRPFIMENVRSAQQFIGQAINHAGPFYLWGNAVPLLLPYKITKAAKTSGHWRESEWRKHSGKSKARKEFSALIAEIPYELSVCVADYASRIIGLE